jgi:hypothetical protein
LNKLFAPTLEEAPTFPDEALLSATSNAVERGYRRHRKMRKMIYRIRTGEHLDQRIAMAMHRDAQAPGRFRRLQAPHYDKNGLNVTGRGASVSRFHHDFGVFAGDTAGD